MGGSRAGTNPENHLHRRFHLSKHTAFLKGDAPGLWSEIFLGCVGLSFLALHLASLALDPSCSTHAHHPPPTSSGP